ncbi:16S rRNA (cytosine(967)-C(5))-methyltransferase RsmB [Tissierella creatinophila]|uniref:16S rRNA (cytosine(967)-C(5))-methyltransferase n=1 Tax=Tissierella creatinophila DSM 6911 TaxID=1123403 RepID=A0A1U7M385_TISCR|nr:16S rRNA (cytosine(967)-C(5))-methyltransferase RsmB [Tissierella creatinophila]OLS01710.1 ribosomal RNA small subunit methyltransferase B [Tissierella creatinophila DSM 6911]
MNINARELSMKILLDINKNKAYSNLSLNKYLVDVKERKDENLIREIIYGVLENLIYIDYIISKASKVKMKKIHPYILEIIRIGIYQIVFMDKIPESAAVNESVKLAKKYGHKGTIGFTNGILRSISREKEKYTSIDVNDKMKYISIKYSHPEDLVKIWIDEFGIDFTQKLCEANNNRPLLNIRINTLKTNKNALINSLKQKGIETVDGKYAEDCLIVKNPFAITETDEFKKGLFTIQDESSMLVAQIMNPKENSRVLDVCSAPGGKSTHIAQVMNNKGFILSRDIYPHKIKLIEENVNRLGIDIIKTEVYDALKRDESLLGKFDYCLLDAPCSGLGLIRRKPEIKLNRKEEDIESLSNLQYKIIQNVKDYIKIGGFLVYSTCTILDKENIDLIKIFLKENPNFKLVDIQDRIKNKEEFSTLNDGYIKLFPHIHKTDGFFIAKMIKER